MNRLFGSKSTAPKPSLGTAVASIESRVASLDVKLTKLNGELATYQQKLSKMREGPGKNAVKQRALKILRQRKQIEAQKDQLETQSWNMEQAVMSTDNMRNTMATLDAMKTAKTELKKQYGKINIDRIETLQDEMADLLDMSAELQETLSRNYAVPDDVSESELDAELEALGDELDLGEFETEQPSYLDESVPTFVDDPVENKEEVAAQ